VVLIWLTHKDTGLSQALQHQAKMCGSRVGYMG